MEIEDRVYIGEAEGLLNRRAATIRGWERDAILPRELMPHRDEKEWRFWTPLQIKGIRKWIKLTDRRPGKGLLHYQPDEAKVEAHIAKTRGPRKSSAL